MRVGLNHETKEYSFDELSDYMMSKKRMNSVFPNIAVNISKGRIYIDVDIF